MLVQHELCTKAFERFFKERKRKLISCSEDDYINVGFYCPIFKDDRGFCKILYAGFHSDFPAEDAGWQLIIHNKVLFFPLAEEKNIHYSYLQGTFANDFFSQLN